MYFWFAVYQKYVKIRAFWLKTYENSSFLIGFKAVCFFAFSRIFEGVGGLISVYFHVFLKGSAD